MVGRVGGSVTGAVLGLVDAADAALDGNAKDVVVQTAGIGGAVGGGLLGGIAAGAAIGSAGLNPVTVTIGEIEVQNFIRGILIPTPNVDRLRYRLEYQSDDARYTVARQAESAGKEVTEYSDALRVNADPNAKFYAHQDRESGAQVITKVVSDPATGQKRAVYSELLPDSWTDFRVI